MRKGQKHSEATIALIRHRCSGKGNGMFGKTHSAKTRAELRRNSLLLWQLKSFRRKMAEGHRRSHEVAQ